MFSFFIQISLYAFAVLDGRKFNMNKLSIYQRPLHCTDVKRETLYIKEDDHLVLPKCLLMRGS